MMTFSPISNEELLFLVVHQPMPFPRVVGLLVVGFTIDSRSKKGYFSSQTYGHDNPEV